jgi:hypothetical protein
MVVYEQADYKNEWDGNANAGTSPGFWAVQVCQMVPICIRFTFLIIEYL